MQKIRVKCVNKHDKESAIPFPTSMVCKPAVGDFVEDGNGVIFEVKGFLHCQDEDGPYIKVIVK